MPALTTLLRSAGLKVGGGIMDDIIAVVSGVADGFLVDKVPLGFLAKNIAVPVLGAVAPNIIPNGLLKESEGMLGFMIYLLALGGKGGGK